jgi:hypothetical protein
VPCRGKVIFYRLRNLLRFPLDTLKKEDKDF